MSTSYALGAKQNTERDSSHLSLKSSKPCFFFPFGSDILCSWVIFILTQITFLYHFQTAQLQMFYTHTHKHIHLYTVYVDIYTCIFVYIHIYVYIKVLVTKSDLGSF